MGQTSARALSTNMPAALAHAAEVSVDRALAMAFSKEVDLARPQVRPRVQRIDEGVV